MVVGERKPNRLNNFPNFIGDKLMINYFPKQTTVFVGADGNKIGLGRRVVMALETDGVTMMEIHDLMIVYRFMGSIDG